MGKRTLIQAFHWYTPEGGAHWRALGAAAARLAGLGITGAWLPPAGKGAAGARSVGYDTYDLFDLGEFDQKGTIATKYGSKADLVAAAEALRGAGIGVLHDVVLNHKIGADEREPVRVRRVDPENRTHLEDEAFDAVAHTRFTFPGRAGRYSAFIWDALCFTGVDRIEEPEEDGLFKIENGQGDGNWNREVDGKYGNFDYLMGADVEFRNEAVREELAYWGRWLMDEVPTDGFRIDAAKHIPAWFFHDWVALMREAAGRDLFVVAEYWHPETEALTAYLELVDHRLSLFDVPLHNRLHHASKAPDSFDLRTLFDGTLVAADPDHAVTFVDNHDTQPLQALESPVDPWFKPHAYALILLREGGVPCVFLPDLDGAAYRDTGGDGKEYDIELPPIADLPRLLEARRRFANGPQSDVFDDPRSIAFVRAGTADAPGCVVCLSTGDAAVKAVDLGAGHAGAHFRDFLGHHPDAVQADADGRADFPVAAGGVAVWVRAEAM